MVEGRRGHLYSYREFDFTATEVLADRDRMIRDLLAAGWTGARVAQVAGISAKQVSLIRNRRS